VSVIQKFAYKLRPGYKSKELLIDFEIPKSSDELQKVIISILKENGFQFKNAHDIWMNDEYLF
jgi:hypothetical protein